MILARGLLARGERVLVGVSGGPDSVALLDALVALQPEFDWQLHIAHFNHHLRGDESDQDEEFVRELAEDYELPCATSGADVRTWAESRKLSLEDAARRLRRAFYQQEAETLGITKLALGHNADDQVETLLQRLLRGAGTHGLAAMAPMGKLAAITIVRPMLAVWKTEILDYLRQRELPFRQDSSNLDTHFQRNKIRHELLPMLEKDYNPALKTLLHQTSEILAAEDEWLESEAARLLNKCRPEPHTLLIAPLLKAHLAVRRRAIYRWLLDRDAPETPLSVDFWTIETLCRMAASGRPTRLALTADFDVMRTEDRLELLRIGSDPPASALEKLEQLVRIPGETNITALALHVETSIETDENIPNVADTPALWHEAKDSFQFALEFEEWFDAGAVGDELTVRLWRPGDRFQPIGMQESKKLQDIFVDEKVPPTQRRRTPLFVAANGEICWVFGYRIGEKFKLTEHTTRALRLRVRPRAH